MLYHRHIEIAFHPVTSYIRDLSFKCRVLSKEASSTIFKESGTWSSRELNQRPPAHQASALPLEHCVRSPYWYDRHVISTKQCVAHFLLSNSLKWLSYLRLHRYLFYPFTFCFSQQDNGRVIIMIIPLWEKIYLRVHPKIALTTYPSSPSFWWSKIQII